MPQKPQQPPKPPAPRTIYGSCSKLHELELSFVKRVDQLYVKYVKDVPIINVIIILAFVFGWVVAGIGWRYEIYGH
jgi:hypothetical protein